MAIILAVIAVVVIGIVVVATVVIARRVQDQGITFDVDESGGLTIGEDQGYGDDPELDALWDECEGGDLASCDDLWLTSPFNSGYERFGATCGDRNEEETPGDCEAGTG